MAKTRIMGKSKPIMTKTDQALKAPRTHRGAFLY